MKPFATGFAVVLFLSTLASFTDAQPSASQSTLATSSSQVLQPQDAWKFEWAPPQTPPLNQRPGGPSTNADGLHRIVDATIPGLKSPDDYRITQYIYETWDTTHSTWVSVERYTYSFDSSTGKTTTYVTEEWSDSLGWVYSSRDVYSYDGSGKETETLFEYWFGGTWHDSTRYYYEYDPSGHDIEYGYESWNGISWKNNFRFQYQFNPSGLLTYQLYQTGNDTGWVNSSNTSYSYGSSQKVLLSISQSWVANAWRNTTKDSNSYDVNDSLINLVFQTWSGSAWNNSGNYTYTYKGGQLTQFLYQTWITDWQNSQMYTYTYDGSGRQIENLFQIWSGGSWMNFSNTQTWYDFKGRDSAVTTQHFNGSWINSAHYTYSYDGNGNRSEFDYQIWKNNNWLNSYRDLYSYGTVLAVHDPLPFLARQFCLEQNYPNPFNPSTEIRFDVPHQSSVVLRVYDLIGQEVATLVNEVKMPGEYVARWNAEKYPSGIYFYRLVAGNFTDTKKLVVLK